MIKKKTNGEVSIFVKTEEQERHGGSGWCGYEEEGSVGRERLVGERQGTGGDEVL